MMTVAEWKQTLKAGKLDKKLKQLYGDDADMLVYQKKRYAAAALPELFRHLCRWKKPRHIVSV